MKKVHIMRNPISYLLCGKSAMSQDNYISLGAFEKLNDNFSGGAEGIRFRGCICQHCLKAYRKSIKESS